MNLDKSSIATLTHFITIDIDVSLKYKRDIRFHYEI